MTERTLFDFPPASHRHDPQTSKHAEREHTASGARATNCDMVLEVVRTLPGRTASEYDEAIPGMDLQEVRRRLTDLKDRDKVYQDAPRKARGRRKAEVTWRAR